MAEIDRVEVLLQLANNQRRDNEEWRNQVWKEGEERARALQATIARFEKEYGALNQELELLRQYLPRPQRQQLPEQPMPKAVTQGPRT